MIYAIAILASFFAIVNAGCDNACSGHGTCGANGICECYDNWGLGLGHYSGDCSQRTCPYEIAFVDSPYLESTYRKGYNHALKKAPSAANADDNTIEVGNFNPSRDVGGGTTPDVGAPYTSVARHKYAECSGRGLCNRDSGECECFPGYEGKGCQRTTCPNDCSGHGRCAYIEKMPYETTAQAGAAVTGDWSFLSQDALTFQYFGWDRHKIRGCICDPEYGDVDCSKRMCPFGTDIMDQRNNLDKAGQYEVQSIWLEARGVTPSATNTEIDHMGDIDSADTMKGRTFALTFKSKLNETFTTSPIVFDVHTGDDVHDFILDIEQALENLPNRVIDDVKVHAAIFKSTKAGTNSLSSPFEGTESTIDGVRINITFSGDHVQGPQNLLTVRAYNCQDGCTPKISGLLLEPNSQAVSVGWVNKFGGAHLLNGGTWYASMKNTDDAASGTDKWEGSKLAFPANKWVGNAMSDFNSYECGRRGKCDYSTGTCGCFAGYTGISCGTITALV